MPFKKTGFDAFVDEQMADPEFRADYQQASRDIDSADALMRMLDEARAVQGISKAELARKVAIRPEAVRRLLATDTPNPTFSTIASLANALGYRIQLVPKDEESAA